MILLRAGMVVVSLLILATSAIIAQPTAAAQTPAGYIALGDSIAYGVGSSLPERRSYPALVREYLEIWHEAPIDHLNLAVPGETADSFIGAGQLDRFREAVEDLDQRGVQLAVVSLSLGGNEMLIGRDAGNDERQIALDQFRETLGSVVEAIGSTAGPETLLVLTTYYDLNDGDKTIQFSESWWVEQFNSVIRDTAGVNDARVAEVDELFRGRLDELTLHPYDVHPKNQGFLAIAGQVWSALALDQEPPVIEVLSDLAATRRWPTLQLEISDNVDVAHLSIVVGERAPVEPVKIGDDQYALLIDLEGVDPVPVSVEAFDSAGNVTRIDLEMTWTAN